MPLLWPLGHVSAAIMKPDDEVPPKKRSIAIMGFFDNLTAFASALRSFILAYVAIYWLYDDNQYPAFGRGKTPRIMVHWNKHCLFTGKNLNWEWMQPILVRNVIATLVICGFWDWFLYFSPLKDKLHKYKVESFYKIRHDQYFNAYSFQLNPAIPSTKQILHDALYTTLASLQAGGLEIGLCWAWSNGYLHMRHESISEAPLTYAILAITTTHWRIPHFYFIHRIMHPWRVD